MVIEKIEILHYCLAKRQFLPYMHVTFEENEDDNDVDVLMSWDDDELTASTSNSSISLLPPVQETIDNIVEPLSSRLTTTTVMGTSMITPSLAWQKDYRDWNIFGEIHQPIFQSVDDLHEFNRKGKELEDRLRQELWDNKEQQKSTHHIIQIQPFLPIYSNISIGGAQCGWWHLKDMNYGIDTHIQKLPVSDALKGDFQAWFRLLEDWRWLNDPITRENLNGVGYNLQKRLLRELNLNTKSRHHQAGAVKPPNSTGGNGEVLTADLMSSTSSGSLSQTRKEQECTPFTWKCGPRPILGNNWASAEPLN